MAFIAGFIVMFTDDSDRRQYAGKVGLVAVAFIIAIVLIVVIVA